MARRNKALERESATERMRSLIASAQSARQEGRPETEVRRYVQLARRIGMRYQVSLPRDLRRRVCRGCDRVLVAGANARHRLANGRVTVTCLACGTIKRYPYKPSQKVSA